MKHAFENIIGQESIKARLSVSLQAPEGISLAQPFFAGEAGLGKTEIAKTFARAMAAKMETDVLWFNSPEEFRTADSADLLTLLNWFENGEGVLVIDECHKFNEKATIAMQRVQSFLLKCLDEQNKGALIQFDADRSFSYDKSRQVIIMMSNYDNRVNPALLSRMDVCRLSPYTVEQLELITVKMAADNELAIDEEKTAKLLAMASRGTARPLNNMVRHIKKYGTDVITREIAIRAMVELEMFPHGLTADEVRLIKLAKAGVIKQVARQALPNLTSINDSVAFLMSRNLLSIVGRDLKATTKGNSYVTNLAKNGFIAA